MSDPTPERPEARDPLSHEVSVEMGDAAQAILAGTATPEQTRDWIEWRGRSTSGEVAERLLRDYAALLAARSIPLPFPREPLSSHGDLGVAFVFRVTGLANQRVGITPERVEAVLLALEEIYGE